MLGKRSVIIQSAFFGIAGLALLYLSFRKVNFKEIADVLKTGSFGMVIPVFLVSLGVYLARVKRWQILFKSIGKDAPTNYLFASLASGYLVNFAVPRLGEITRALVLKKSLSYPVNTSLATIVFERMADIICLLIILLVAVSLELIYQGSLLHSFMGGVNWASPLKIILLLFLGSLAFLVYKIIKGRNDALSQWLTQLIQSTIDLFKMKQKGLFLLYTLVIWIGFFLMTYLWIFLFTESAGLTVYQAYLLMTLGVVARTLPIQAGSAGAYHFVISRALLLMGIGLSTGNALAIVIHGFQTILTLFFGAGAYLWLLSRQKEMNDLVN